MMLKLKIPFLLICLSALFSACKKEYSQEAAPLTGTSVFSFAGSPGTCTNAVVAGTYKAGTALGAANIVTIGVTVTKAGTYNISSGTVNGISFTGSGTFAATGAQTIALVGTGIPAASGSFSFNAGTNSCSFSVTVSGADVSTSVFSYSGFPGACTNATPEGTYAKGTALTAGNKVTIGVNVTTIGTYFVSTDQVNGFSFSGSGSFTALGIQTITLTASGVPAAEGTFNFTPSNDGCAFPIVVVAGTVLTDYLKCTIDGVAKTFNINLVGGLADTTTFAIGGEETSDTASASFTIGLLKTPAITTGIYNKFSATSINQVCIISYDDGVSSTGWASALLLQSGGFTVNVLTLTANTITGTFSGTLYDNDGQGTATKAVTAGSFSLNF
jgi:hypothetical protein